MSGQVTLTQFGYTGSTLGEFSHPAGLEPSVRPWEPYKRQAIKVTGTIKSVKTDITKEWGRREIRKGGNHLDTVRGCPGGAANLGRGCFGDCNAKEASRRFHKLFDIPVSMILKEKPLGKQLDLLIGDCVRNGVTGDPSTDWPLGIRTMHFADQYDITTIFLTRFWKVPTDYMFAQMAKNEAIIHGSLSALDPQEHIDIICDALDRYEDLGGRSVRRVVTAPFKEDSLLWDVQDDLMSLPNVLQQPLRFRGTNPFIHLFDLSKVHGVKSNTSGKITNRWRSGKKYLTARYTDTAGCLTNCWSCGHQCMFTLGGAQW